MPTASVPQLSDPLGQMLRDRHRIEGDNRLEGAPEVVLKRGVESFKAEGNGGIDRNAQGGAQRPGAREGFGIGV
jgi:hypothetical protein